jgi:hypothetical protein
MQRRAEAGQSRAERDKAKYVMKEVNNDNITIDLSFQDIVSPTRLDCRLYLSPHIQTHLKKLTQHLKRVWNFRETIYH